MCTGFLLDGEDDDGCYGKGCSSAWEGDDYEDGCLARLASINGWGTMPYCVFEEELWLRNTVA